MDVREGGTETSTTLARWRESIARSFVPMEVEPSRGTSSEGFTARVTRAQIGAVGLSVVHADAHRALRTARTLALHPADYYKFNLQLEGASRLTQDGRTALLGRGDMAVYDTTRPFELDFDDEFECAIVQFPRDALEIAPAIIDAVTGTRLAAGSGLADAAMHLVSTLVDGTPAAAPLARRRAADALVEVIGAILLDAADAPDDDDVDDALLASVTAYVDAHLSNPSLSIGDVAAAHFVSVRTLQRALQAHGATFAGLARHRRLARAYERLTGSDATVTHIAHETGFVSAAHFSRAFRAQYARSPSDLRRGIREP